MQDRTHAGSDPPRLLAPYAHALCVPSMHSARKLAGRRAACIDSAAQEEPICSVHVTIEVLEVVLAASQIGKEAVRMVVVACVDPELRQQSRVDEVGVAEVAVQECEGCEALRVGEHR